MPSLKILFVSPEVEPFAKVGGLADMVGTLPKELDKLGHDVRVMCPAYGHHHDDAEWRARPEPLGVDVGNQAEWARTWETSLPGTAVPIYFIEHEQFFGRPEVYAGPWGAHEDNDLRFAFFCRAALSLCLQLEWVPDVIHCHDWTTGFVPLYLNTVLRESPLGKSASVFTIHNLEHQGLCDRRVLNFARIPQSEFRPDSTESLGMVNMMKAGLYHATKITTVSPTYAKEIRTPEGGFGLHDVLNFRGADLIGVLNGIDMASWNPATDLSLPARYSLTDLSCKTVCKIDVQASLGLARDSHIALFGVVSRFARQKGLDHLAGMLPHLLENMHLQFAVLGSGDSDFEQALLQLAGRFPDRFAVRVGYNDSLARRIIAGSDFFVMPSRSEPCGLTQLYAMRYGSVPVARATGGLVDTIAQYDEKKGTGTGLLFQDSTPGALYDTIGWACSTYYDRPAHMQSLRRAGMSANFGWRTSAERYLNIYQWAIRQRLGSE